MSDVIENARTHGYVYAAIAETWGERCSDFEPECLTCRAWAEFGQIARLKATLADVHAAAGNNHLIANIARAALEEKS